MRRHSTWLLSFASIVIVSLIAENEVTAAPVPAPAPCFFGLGFGMDPYPFRRPKEEKDKDQKEKLKKAGDTLMDDFRRFTSALQGLM